MGITVFWGELGKELGLVFLKFSGCDPDECGADAVGGVGEQEVVADGFDSEVDGGFDQELIAIGDGEVADDVVAC